ncbi:MAG: tetratricopeptide (TPR) repeat protein [Bacteroidia bacterium]|jgi:tetratricopeptide (TPR) repeat protein
MTSFLSQFTKFDKRAIAFIVLGAIIVFGNSIKGDFLMAWDDNQQIIENEDVTHLSLQSIKNYFTTFYVVSYQPLASLSFGIEYAIFGKNAKVHHITNLICHLINIALVYMLILALFKDKYIPLIVATFFAIHPFQTEVLGWISTRSTFMYACFILIASNIFVYRIKRSEGKISGKTLVLVLFFYLLAILTKSASIVFPFTLILLYVLVVGTWNWKLLIKTIPFFAGSVIAGLVSISSRKSGGETFSTFYSFYSFKEHVLIRLKTLYFYLIEPFYQTKLHIYRAFYTNPDKVTGALLPDYFLWQSVVAVMVLGILTYVAFRNRNNTIGKLLIFGLLWFFINIGLHFNFFAVSVTMVAERYMYLPLIGLALILVGIIQLFIKTYPKIKLNTAYIFVFVPLFLFYGFTTNRQIEVWKNETSLYNQDIKYTQYYYSYLQLGRIYHKRKLYQKALETYNAYVKMNPNEPKIYLYRALIINDMGDAAYAEKDLYRILDLRKLQTGNEVETKINGQAFYHLGLIWQNKDKNKSLVYLDSAIQLGNSDAVGLQQSLKMEPNEAKSQSLNADTYDYKSKLSKEGRAEEGSVYEIVPRCLADKKYNKALYYIEMMEMVAPDSAITYLLKAKAYVGLNKNDLALEVLDEAIVEKRIDSPELNSLKASLED